MDDFAETEMIEESKVTQEAKEALKEMYDEIFVNEIKILLKQGNETSNGGVQSIISTIEDTQFLVNGTSKSINTSIKEVSDELAKEQSIHVVNIMDKFDDINKNLDDNSKHLLEICNSSKDLLSKSIESSSESRKIQDNLKDIKVTISKNENFLKQFEVKVEEFNKIRKLEIDNIKNSMKSLSDDVSHLNKNIEGITVNLNKLLTGNDDYQKIFHQEKVYRYIFQGVSILLSIITIVLVLLNY